MHHLYLKHNNLGKKYLGQSKEIKLNLSGTTNFDNYSCVFWPFYKNFISGRSTRR